MRIEWFEADSFRNLAPGRCEFAPGVNLIAGKNGQGKTNLLEGLYLFCGQKSFRTTRDAELPSFGTPKAELRCGVFSGGREQTLDLCVTTRRTAARNGIACERVSQLGETVACVVFSPAHTGIVSGGPEQRRAFLDVAVTGTKPAFTATLREFDKLLYHRNYLLKKLSERRDDETADLLAAYTQRFAAVAARVFAARSRYTRRLAETAPGLYAELSGGEQLLMEYKPSVEAAEGEYRQALYAALCATVAEDTANGFTGLGPQREDFELTVEGKKARIYASQGQTKSAALCLKLAEGRILEAAIGEPAVYLLDDVMSELDKNRRDYVLTRLGESQTFITCCEPGILRRKLQARVFTVRDGQIRSRTQ